MQKTFDSATPTEKQILLAKYDLTPSLWANESLERIKKWVWWFKGEATASYTIK